MFNREIQVRVAKKNKADETDTERVYSTEDYIAMSKQIFDGATSRVVKVVVTYVALDTARKIVVNRLSK